MYGASAVEQPRRSWLVAQSISVAERLARLDPEQRAAATAPPGPILCVAPAGSGKTSTLVARIAWLVDTGVDPGTITALTFNRRAAEELTERLEAAMPEHDGGAKVRVRTFHALGLEILREAGEAVTPLLDREAVLRELIPRISMSALRRLDTIISRFKLNFMVSPDEVAADPDAGPTATAFVAYERAIADSGGLDFDDLVARAVRRLETDATVLATWRARAVHLLVDEAQDLDRMQLRMAIALASPDHRIFLVGDDDQSIYGWRLADVRRLLTLAETSLPGLRRHDLATNYRCPGPVVERAVRLVAHNRERFDKSIRARTRAPGSLILAPTQADPADACEALIRSWPTDDSTRAILARTNRELLPAVAACLTLGVPFRARDLELPLEAADLDTLLDAATEDREIPLVARAARLRDASRGEARAIASALLDWAPAFPDPDSFRDAVTSARERLAGLRRDDAALSLATVHGTKGLEFDHVAVIGLDAGRFPSARSIEDAEDPERALEEERRLAYVAWTRARRTLSLSYDPAAPSPFLLEAFDERELRGVA
ncbi:MAG: ATP-dependent helicase [Chloroflexota bacterium]|nr:MAG: ATP-dependent helicase [Chloroflexota bacterium]